MNKKKITLIIAAIIIVIAIVVGYIYWQRSAKTTPQESAIKEAENAAEKITESASQGVLPDVAPIANPYEGVSKTNPAEKANPFKSIKTNPFE